LIHLKEPKLKFTDYLYAPVAIVINPVLSYRTIVVTFKVDRYLKKELSKSNLFEKKQIKTIMEAAYEKTLFKDMEKYIDFHKVHYLAYVTDILLWIRLHSGSSYEVKHLCSKIMKKIYEDSSTSDLSYEVSATDKMIIDYNNVKFEESESKFKKSGEYHSIWH